MPARRTTGSSVGRSSRRSFVAILTAVVAVGWRPAQAQQGAKVHRIGVLGVASAAGYARQADALRQGLRNLGYVEGRNVVIDFRWADGDPARLPELAAQLVRSNPDVIVTSGPGNAVAKRATSTIPVVMAVSQNAAETGLVASLARPGGNVTGTSSFSGELTAKRLELIKEVIPGIARAGLLLNARNQANPGILQSVESAARSLNVQLISTRVGSSSDLDRAFADLAAKRVDALVVGDDTTFVAEAPRIAELALGHRLPAVGSIEVADGGGLVGYGVDFPDLWLHAAYFVDRILRGTKPADIPVEQPKKFELVLNRNAARALGVKIPSAVMVRADRIVD